MTSVAETAVSASPRVPGPRRLPVIGQLTAGLRLATQPLELFQEHYRRYGPLSALTSFQNGKQGTVLAFGPALNREILSNPETFHNPNLMAVGVEEGAFRRLSSGLLSMNGERHRQQRRLMMPSFHKAAVVGYGALIAGYTAAMLQRWGTLEKINLMTELRQLILCIISHALFGLENAETNEHIGSLIYHWTRSTNAPQNLLLPPLHRRLNCLSEQLEGALLDIITQKRAEEPPGNDVLSLLLRAQDEDGARMTDEELLGHLALLFIAGYETTVNALAWTLILLSHYPAIRLELQNTLDDELNGGTPTVEQAYAVPLLDQVIRESMRLLPPVTFGLRMVAEPTSLGGYALAKDSMVIFSQFMTHRLPDIYAQPDQFKPERWETLDVSPYEYLPFSTGSRMCIGASFASLEIRIVLAMMLSRFQVVPVGNIDYQVTGGLLRPKGEIPSALYPATETREPTSWSASITKLVR